MTRGIGGFVEIDHTRTNILLEFTFERRASNRYRSEVTSANEQPVVIFEQERPIAGVDDWSDVFGLNGVFLLSFLLGDNGSRHIERKWKARDAWMFLPIIIEFAGGQLRIAALPKFWWVGQTFTLKPHWDLAL